MKNLIIFFRKNLYTSIVFIIGFFVLIGLLIYFCSNYFRLWQLILKFKLEFLFLLISGYFLYSFKYDILKTELSFNAFIIYISNIILYIEPNSGESGLLNYNFNALVLILFFLFLYFLIQIFIYLFFKKLTIYKLELIIVRIVLWALIIIFVNYIIYFLKINIVNLQFKDIILIPFILLSHTIIKLIFSFFERTIQRKYFDFFYQVISFIVVDTILILFAILLGSIYRKIDLINTAIFISFLAIVVSLMKYIINKNSLNIVFYHINSFLEFNDLYNIEYPPLLPIDFKIDLEKILNKNIKYIGFVVLKVVNGNTEEIILKLKENNKKYRYYIYKDNICFMYPIFNSDSIKDIHNIKNISGSNTIGAYCAISRSNWNYIDINYLFRILSEILNKKFRCLSNKNVIIKVKEEYIFF